MVQQLATLGCVGSDQILCAGGGHAARWGACHAAERTLCLARCLALCAQEDVGVGGLTHGQVLDHVAGLLLDGLTAQVRRGRATGLLDLFAQLVGFCSQQLTALVAVHGGAGCVLDRAVGQHVAVLLVEAFLDLELDRDRELLRGAQIIDHLDLAVVPHELGHDRQVFAALGVDRELAAKALARQLAQRLIAKLVDDLLTVQARLASLQPRDRLVGTRLAQLFGDGGCQCLALGVVGLLALQADARHQLVHQALAGLVVGLCGSPAIPVVIAGVHACGALEEQRCDLLLGLDQRDLFLGGQHPVHDLADFRGQLDLQVHRLTVDPGQPRLEPLERRAQRDRWGVAVHDIGLKAAGPCFLLIDRVLARVFWVASEVLVDRAEIIQHALRGLRIGGQLLERLEEEVTCLVRKGRTVGTLEQADDRLAAIEAACREGDRAARALAFWALF